MIDQILGDFKPMLSAATDSLSQLKLEDHNVVCDHICYRVETNSRYKALKTKLLKLSDLVAETEVNTRLISIFKLHSPIIYKNYTIDCIELPAPKTDNKYKEGWEHAEFVILNLKKFIKINHQIIFNHKAMDRKINPELALQINNNYQIKFHPLHILDVIKKEQELGINKVT